MRILLTGFNPFGELVVNPSQILVQYFRKRAERCDQDELVTEILRTEFAAAEDRIRHLIRQTRPEAIVCLGVAAGLDMISLERVALNLDATDVPDNAGESRSDQLIVADGPIAYWSTLPLERIRAAMWARGIPVIISNHAGTYVCNHVFYVARHELEITGSSAQCGLIHLPLMTEQIRKPMVKTPGLPFAMLATAIECCFEMLQGGITGIPSDPQQSDRSML